MDGLAWAVCFFEPLADVSLATGLAADFTLAGALLDAALFTGALEDLELAVEFALELAFDVLAAELAAGTVLAFSALDLTEPAPLFVLAAFAPATLAAEALSAFTESLPDFSVFLMAFPAPPFPDAVLTGSAFATLATLFFFDEDAFDVAIHELLPAHLDWTNGDWFTHADRASAADAWSVQTVERMLPAQPHKKRRDYSANDRSQIRCSV
ncbi:MAG: hypothetical protein AB7F96_14635 [Beijerinckiaceae bacterium]